MTKDTSYNPLVVGVVAVACKWESTHTFNYYYEPLQTIFFIPNSLTIKPYLVDVNESSPKIERVKWEGRENHPFSQGKIGHLTILELTRKTMVSRTVRLKSMAKIYIISPTPYGLKIQMVFGISPTTSRLRRRFINQYQASFSVTPTSNDLYITTVTMSQPNYLKELEVTIHLKE